MHISSNQRGSTSGVTLAIIAVIISVIALILAWMAYERIGADLDERIQQQVNQSTQEIQEDVQQGADAIEDGIQEGAESLDAGPDGVDQDDTSTPQETNQSSDGSTETPTQ